MSDLLDRPLGRAEHASLVEEGSYGPQEQLASSDDAPATRSAPPLRIHLTGPPPAWLDELLPRFSGYLTLQPGWDSYRARCVSRRAVSTAIVLLAGAARRPDRVLPTSGGGVQLEWDGDPEFELEVRADGVAHALLEEGGTTTEAVYASRDRTVLAGVLSRL